MNTKTVTGILAAVAEYAVHDYLAAEDVIDASVETVNGLVPFRFVPRLGFTLSIEYEWLLGSDVLKIDPTAQTNLYRIRTTDPLYYIDENKKYVYSSICVRPAIGDLISVRWDYGQCFAQILKLAEDRTQLCEWTYPVTRSRVSDLGTIADSYFED